MNLQANPLIVDAVMNAGAGLGKILHVTKVIWHNPTAAGNTFVIKGTQTGSVILQGYAQAANQSQVFDFLSPFPFPTGAQGQNDWRVTALDSGTLMIYVLA